jgi:hypothetical protein
MPYTDVNGDAIAVDLGRLERQIIRNALNGYQADLEAAGKKDRALGVPNEVTALYLSVISGENGWGKGLYAKLSEQMTIDDELEAVNRAVSDTLDALASVAVEVPEPAVRAWSAEEREAVRAWAPALARQRAAKTDEERAAVEVPNGGQWPGCVRDALQEQATALDEAAGVIVSLCPMASHAQVLNDAAEARKAVRWAVDESKARAKADGAAAPLYPTTLAAKRALEKHHSQPL